MNIGCHVSIAKGIDKAPEIAGGLGCEAIQIFTHSPSGGSISDISAETAKNFKAEVKKHKIKAVYVHTPYYINLASKNNKVYHGSISAIRKNLDRASLLGAKYLMMHLGSLGDTEEKEMFKKMKDGFASIFEGYNGSTKLLIENSAGAGKTIGSNFKQIGKILKISSTPDFDEKMAGVCLDTQHSFASGYNWSGNFSNCIKELDKHIGIKNIKLFHTNDSLTEFNSRKDRHTHIGKGKIGLTGFEKLTAFAKKNDIDMICETTYPGIANDIKILKEMRNEK